MLSACAAGRQLCRAGLPPLEIPACSGPVGAPRPSAVANDSPRQATFVASPPPQSTPATNARGGQGTATPCATETSRSAAWVSSLPCGAGVRCPERIRARRLQGLPCTHGLQKREPNLNFKPYREPRPNARVPPRKARQNRSALPTVPPAVPQRRLQQKAPFCGLV
jgi:hypothetical protein